MCKVATSLIPSEIHSEFDLHNFVLDFIRSFYIGLSKLLAQKVPENPGEYDNTCWKLN